MNRPLHVWLAFALCAAVVLAVMTWVSLTTLRLDRLQFAAGQTAELEERVRLALWRMDSWLASLIVEESARPAAAYEAFQAAARAYTKTYSQLKQGDVLVPSPLLHYASSNILLHFQLHPDGRLTSPQVPAPPQRDLAAPGIDSGADVKTASRRLAALRRFLDQPASGAPPVEPGPRAGPAPPDFAAGSGDDHGAVLLRQAMLPPPALPLPAQEVASGQPPVPPQVFNTPAQMAQAQAYRNTAEFNIRANTFQQAQQRLSVNNLKMLQSEAPSLSPPEMPAGEPSREGLFRAWWLGDALVLARRVDRGKTFVVQGCWLNWTNVRTALLGLVADLFPSAQLQPMRAPNGERHARMLAALPVKLLTGPAPPAPPRRLTPLQLSLLVSWAGVALAGLAVALLLHGALSLSERRAAFVSAVTHELRTPLTTFKLYSEMLAGGMVSDDATRQSYLATLCAEANRLGHLVENVLAYARLERGRARHCEERLTLGELVGRVRPRLVQRAEQGGMTLSEDVAPAARDTVVRVDVSAIEQILFNLVDNACKYAAPTANPKIIHLEALPDPGPFAMLRVRDHGRGISPPAARRLFRPFSKSARQAAHTAPGVGLGLALCRRLSRSMGGDLRLADCPAPGAAFVLSLPVSAAGLAGP
ncbi:MAG: HAMP domain-containing histidine kinase [Verrucomicrobia bacterium]|nr:HAMP domain-containing histidine kinase [Verrucomicrobiota bacterium]